VASVQQAFANVEADKTGGTRNQVFHFVPLSGFIVARRHQAPERENHTV
jgi:hypothetical protein